MERYLETTFRFKWLFLAVLLVVPAVGIRQALRSQVPLYTSVATVWADKPLYLTAVADTNAYESPAQNQAGGMAELLGSDSFAEEVIDQTNLKGVIKTRNQQQAALLALRQNVKIAPAGQHLITISFADPSPTVANQMVKGIINSFANRVLADANSQSSTALAFYQKQLDDANAKLADANASLRSYMDAHPELSATSPDQLPDLLANASFNAQHPEVVKLVQTLDQATKDQQRLQDQVNNIRFTQSQADIGQQQSFKVLDPATTPLRPTSSLKKLLLPIGLALGVAIGFTVGGIILLTLFDTTLRSQHLAAARFQLPVVGSVPLLPARPALLRRGQYRRRDLRALLALEARAATSGALPE